MKNHLKTLKIGALGTLVAVAVLAGCDRPESDTSSSTVVTPPAGSSSSTTTSPAPGTSGYVGPGESSSSSSMSPPPPTTDTAPGSSSSSTSGGPGQSDTATPGTSGYVGGAAESPRGATMMEEQQRQQNQSGPGGSSNMSPSGPGGSGTVGPNSSLDQRPFRDVAIDGAGVVGPAAWRNLFGVQAIRVADDKSGTTMDKMPGDQPAGMKLSKKDRNFINKAAAGGMFEVEAARLAAEKATDPQVKSFAAKLLDQHQQSNEELKQIASNKGVTLPTQLPSKERAMIDRLSKASSDKFDQEFLKTVGLKDHKEDIRQFENASKETTDTELKAWIDKTLPTLRTHLAEAQTMSGHGMKMQGYMGTEKENKPGSGMTGGAAGESGTTGSGKQGGGGY